MKCPACSAENPESGKFCSQCGLSLTGEERGLSLTGEERGLSLTGEERGLSLTGEERGLSLTGEERGVPLIGKGGTEVEPADRFKTLVAVLIAIVSLVGAGLAYRIALAAGGAAEADVAGIVSSVNLHQARVASEAELYRDLGAYLQVRIHDQLSHDLNRERDQYSGGDPARDQLWEKSWTETRVAEAYLDAIYVRPEVIRPDGSYDEGAALDLSIAHRALEVDFNREEHFAEAKRLRVKAQWLVGMAFFLTMTLLLYTLAEVTTHGSRYLFLGLGTGTFMIVIVGTLAIELLMA